MNGLDARLASKGIFDALRSRSSFDALGNDLDPLESRWSGQDGLAGTPCSVAAESEEPNGSDCEKIERSHRQLLYFIKIKT